MDYEEALMAKAAWYYYFENLTQQQISDRIGISRLRVVRLLEKARDGAALLVLDEAVSACRHGIIPQEELLRFLDTRPEGLEVVLTGRDPAPELLELADYVTEMRKIRHPYDRGIRARKGVEF